MINLRTSLGASGGTPATLDLYDNQEILTNSSSLYDEHQSKLHKRKFLLLRIFFPVIAGYGKPFVEATVTSNSPTVHTGQSAMNVILKNPLRQSNTSIDSTAQPPPPPPPLYHSVYNNFAPWKTSGLAQSSDLLLMDVTSYYGDAVSSSTADTILGGGAWSTASTLPVVNPTFHPVPYSPAQQSTSASFTTAAELYSVNPMLIPSASSSSAHVSTTVLSSPNAPPPSYQLNDTAGFTFTTNLDQV